MLIRASHRAARQHRSNPPFYALLADPVPNTRHALARYSRVPVDEVPGIREALANEHLSAMRYPDWAFGPLFEQIREKPYYDQTTVRHASRHGLLVRATADWNWNLLRFQDATLLLDCSPGACVRALWRKRTTCPPPSPVDIVTYHHGPTGPLQSLNQQEAVARV